jgi:hypothetical protein
MTWVRAYRATRPPHELNVTTTVSLNAKPIERISVIFVTKPRVLIRTKGCGLQDETIVI